MNAAIYLIRCKANGRVYVGQARNFTDRVRRHRQLLERGKHPNRYLQRAWKKHGPLSFEFSVLEEVENPAALTEREQFWFDQMRPFAPQGFNVVKVAEGPPMAGRSHTVSARAKMREHATGMAGKKHRKESKQTQSANIKALWEDPEYRERMCRAMRVPKLKLNRAELRARMSEISAKAFVAIAPDGTKYEGKNLKAFCLANSLPYESMVSVARGTGRARFYGRGRDRKGVGWQCSFV